MLYIRHALHSQTKGPKLMERLPYCNCFYKHMASRIMKQGKRRTRELILALNISAQKWHHSLSPTTHWLNLVIWHRLIVRGWEIWTLIYEQTFRWEVCAVIWIWEWFAMWIIFKSTGDCEITRDRTKLEERRERRIELWGAPMFISLRVEEKKLRRLTRTI